MEQPDPPIEEPLPLVTINSPSTFQLSPSSSHSSSYLVRSASLIHLSPHSQNYLPNSQTITKLFSISSNGIHQTHPRSSLSQVDLRQQSAPLDYETLRFTRPQLSLQMEAPPKPAVPSFWSRFKCRTSSSKSSSPSSSSHKLNRLLYYLRIFLTHLFSTTGLCVLVAAYSGLGALIFGRLESRHEAQVQEDMNTERHNLASELWNITYDLNVLKPNLWKRMAVKRIETFEGKVKTALGNGYGNAEQWSFSGALLYSVTVITTIGYGDVTCKTSWGRIATILYAIVGIPITFLCLANLGNLMAKAFRFSYRKICCCECFCPSTTTLALKAARRARAASLSRSASVKRKRSLRRGGNGSNAAAFARPKTNGTSVPGATSGQTNSAVVLSQPLATSTDASPPSPAVTVLTLDLRGQHPEDSDLELDDLEVDLDQAALDALEDEERVPISLVFLIVLGYIILGASIFSFWEGWDYVEGAYFCFTTLTTIGFGDLVPGSAKYSEGKDGKSKFIICCAYMLVGLALIAMSFNLAQEEIVIKCRRVARRLGIMPSNQETAKFNKRHFRALWTGSETERGEFV